MSIFLFFLLVAILPFPLAAQTNVRLAWNAPSNIPMYYIMERKTGLFGTYAVVGHPIDTEWEDEDIPSTNNVSLCWQVRAFNELGVSEPSNELCLSLPDVLVNIRIETFGPSETAPRVSARTKVKVKQR